MGVVAFLFSKVSVILSMWISAAVHEKIYCHPDWHLNIQKSHISGAERGKMNINEFAQKVCRAVGEELGAKYNVELKEVRKNNGVMLHGLLISSGEGNVVPTIYLEHFFRVYEEGMTFGEIIRRLLEVHGQDVPARNIDMEFFRSYEKVCDRICYRLIGRAGNEELLKDIPFVDFLDMAICFFYAYKGESLGEGSIMIHNSHMEMWKCGVADLMERAQQNTPKLFPWQCCTMEEVLREVTDKKLQEELLTKEVPMRVLSNHQRMNGAVCLIYQGVMEKLAEEHQADLYILPSSIHEVILLPDSGKENPDDLKSMIVQVNRTQVAPEEVLSDSLYRYDRGKRRVEIIM